MNKEIYLNSLEKTIRETLFYSCDFPISKTGTLEQLKKSIHGSMFFDNLFYIILALFKENIDSCKELSDKEKQSYNIDAADRARKMVDEYRKTFCILELFAGDFEGCYLLPEISYLDTFLKKFFRYVTTIQEGNVVHIYRNTKKLGYGYIEAVSA